jgi:hypothetical protein
MQSNLVQDWRRSLSAYVREAVVGRAWVRHISGALTMHVLVEYVLLWERLETVVLQPGVPDRFVWRWSPDAVYSSSSAYKAFFHGLTLLPGARQLWRASVPPKVKFFAWLALRGRLWTSDRRRRHDLQDDASCALCDQEDETTDHLLLGCVFAREVWHRLLRKFRLPLQPPAAPSTLVDWWLSSRGLLPRALRRGFDSVVLLVAWSVWKERNRRTFEGLHSSALEVVRSIVEEGQLWVSAGFRALEVIVVLSLSE